MTAVPPPGLHDKLAEQAWGVLVAAADRELVPLHGARSWSVVAHAIVGNLLPLIEADRQAEIDAAVAQELEEAAEELGEYVAHAAQEAREWEPDTTRVADWEGKQSAYAWSAYLLRTRAAARNGDTR